MCLPFLSCVADMGKSLKIIDNKPDTKQGDLELLVSHDRSRTARGSSFGARVKLHVAFFVIGVVGSASCLWAMLDTHNSKVKMQDLGLHKVANSLDNILELLAYPVLMFTMILALYAAQQLFRFYRMANDPETYRRNRSNR